VIHSPILPSCLDSFSFPSVHPGITFLLSVLMSSSCLPSLTMSSPLIVVRVSQSAQQVHPMSLDVLSSPLSFCLQKKGGLSRMILQIIALLIASIGTATTLKQNLCITPMAPSFSTVCHQCNLSPGRDLILSAGGNDGQLNPCPGLVREGECGIWRTAKPSPPPTTKGGMFAIRRMALGRGDTEKEQRQNGDEVYGTDAVFVVGFGRKY
jgi:hypothetical protein